MFDFGSETIRSITLKGLTIIGCTNKLQNEGFGARGIYAAIYGKKVFNLTLDNIIIHQSGGSGVNILGNGNLLQNLTLKDLYGGGIYIVGNNNIIRSSKILSVGIFFKGALGVYENGSNNKISRLRIDKCPYTGISINGRNSQVLDSQISNVMEFMNDGAGIYCSQRDSIVIKNNVIFGTNKAKIGIYFDEKVSNAIAESNSIINFLYPIHCHLANNILIKNNLISSKNAQTIRFRNSSNIIVTENIFLSPDLSIDDFNSKRESTSSQLRQNFVLTSTNDSSNGKKVLLKSENKFYTLNDRDLNDLNQNLITKKQSFLVNKSIISKYLTFK